MMKCWLAGDCRSGRYDEATDFASQKISKKSTFARHNVRELFSENNVFEMKDKTMEGEELSI
jgi:hypothetical protein